MMVCMTLIVEDNALFRQSLRDILYTKFPSMTIEEAVDGKEALQKIEELPPDLIFMDIRLPDKNLLSQNYYCHLYKLQYIRI